MRYECLIVDDEEALSQSTCEYFTLFGLSAFWVADADSCLAFFNDNSADVILLDINLKHSSGFDLCKRLRELTPVPILFISARQSDDDKLLALSIGGDDYIQKPYALSVLLAKVKVVLARYRASLVPPAATAGAGAAGVDAALIVINGLTLDEVGGTVLLDGQRLELKMMEFKLLSYLMRNRGRVVGKEELFRRVWEDAFVGVGTLNVHVRRLREKIERDPNNPRFIKTVWGIGYVFEGDDQ